MLADGAARSGAENMSSEPAAGVVVAALRMATVSGLQEHRASLKSFLTAADTMQHGVRDRCGIVSHCDPAMIEPSVTGTARPGGLHAGDRAPLRRGRRVHGDARGHRGRGCGSALRRQQQRAQSARGHARRQLAAQQQRQPQRLRPLLLR